MKTWVSAHLFYHQDVDRLLLELVDPLLVELADSTPESFFLRYWNGGPHLRLRIRPASPELHADVEDLVRRRAQEYFTRCPSPDLMTQAEYLAAGRDLARWEGVTLIEQMYPNNSIQLISYAPEHDRYGHGESMRAAESHFAESSGLALELLRAGASPAQRETAVMAYLMLSWFIASDDLADLVSRQLGAVARSPVDQRTSALSIAAYERQQESLQKLAGAMRATAENWPQFPQEGGFVRWARTVSQLADTLSRDDTVSATRVVDLSTHLIANRLGVRIDAEGTLRYMAARTIQDSLVAGDV